MKLPFLSVAICSLLLTGCFTGYKPGEISKAIGDKPGMTKLNLNSVYGRGDYLHINPLPSHSYTVAPDGTVRIDSAPVVDPKAPVLAPWSSGGFGNFYVTNYPLILPAPNTPIGQ